MTSKNSIERADHLHTKFTERKVMTSVDMTPADRERAEQLARIAVAWGHTRANKVAPKPNGGPIEKKGGK
jgi:hypothetical protein